MAAPSTAYLSKFSNSEKTDPTMLLTTHDVGKIFLNLIETSGLRLSEREIQNEAGVSAEALKYFLDSIESKTVGDFKRFLEESGELKPEGYAKLKKIYGQLRLKSFTWGLYLIDKELLVKRGGIFASPDRPGSEREMVKIMLSAILWIGKLDCSSDKHEWKSLFVRFNRDRLNQDLRRLWGARLLLFLKDESQLILPEEARTSIEKLWAWFDTHDQRPIKLAFCMARQGMLLEISGKMGEVHFFIDEVERTEKYF